MARALGTVWPWAAALGLAACTSLPSPPAPPATAEILLRESHLFEPPLEVTPIPADEVFRVDDEIRAFITEEIGGTNNRQLKLTRLLAALERRGLESLDYSGTTTRTVSQTFDERVGNCLSYTMLFVSLARAADLDADYQIVKTPPVWSTVNDQIIISDHINAVVRGAREYIVDFNLTQFKLDYQRRKIDDEQVLALYYSNVGAEALIEEEYERSFVYLREAIRTNPDIPAPWANLGVLYSRLGRYEEAEAAYLHALEADPRDNSSLTNLAALYTATGNEAEAARYWDMIHRYQQRNPYYHYSQARQAYREERFEHALSAVTRAKRLARNVHEFHWLAGLAERALGREDRAERSFSRARKLAPARYDGSNLSYDAELETLSQSR